MIDFDDLDDDLNAQGVATEAPAYQEEQCPSCRGTGQFRSFTGRLVGSCFKCQGKGTLRFKQPAEVRAKARAAAATRRVVGKLQNFAAFAETHPAAARWIEDKRPTFDFAQSMFDAITKYGHLTEKQLASVLKCVDKDEASKKAAAERVASAKAVEIERIEVAFGNAKTNGIKRPRLRLADYTFKPAPDTGRNAGSIYVTDADKVYLGKVSDGKFIRSRDCNEVAERAIIAACADPEAAAHAYGQRTGQCSCCGRELTAAESINRSIGPICAAKYGW